jgi:hypothetical protein
MTKVFVKTWCADDHAWKVRTCHAAMTPTLTREIGVEDAMRQAYYSHRDMVFPTIENDDDCYFPRHRAKASSCKIAKIKEGESARLVEIVPLVVALNSALDRSQLDQRDLWLEIEQLRAKVDAYERQQEQWRTTARPTSTHSCCGPRYCHFTQEAPPRLHLHLHYR